MTMGELVSDIRNLWAEVRGLRRLMSGIPARFASPSGGGASKLPVPTAQYQVLQCTAFTNSNNYTVDYDFVRGS